MPVVGVNRDKLFAALGQTFSKLSTLTMMPISSFHWSNLYVSNIIHSYNAAEKEFEELCFEYGIELDDVVSYFYLLAALQSNEV